MPLEVRCAGDGEGYRCSVEVSDSGSTSHHLVRVSREEFDRWRHGRTAEELVADSFVFLLQREPKESILRAFDLSAIHRYFPDYDGAKRP